MILASDVLLPDEEETKILLKRNMNIYFTEVTIPSSSELVGQSVK